LDSNLSFFRLVSEASLTVQLVMAVLLLASIASWYMIGAKHSSLERSPEWDRLALRDEVRPDFHVFTYQRIAAAKRAPSGMASLFAAGFKEFARLRQHAGGDQTAVLEGTQRAMRVALAREVDDLETHLSFLATVGSTSPYIGLFGTVWGIMNSFSALGNVHQGTLAMVAPGIAEALIATAMGLFAAIPAVIAYNQYSSQVERLINRYDTFLEEFSSILQRQTQTR